MDTINKPLFRYLKDSSIVYKQEDEFKIPDDEMLLLYKFCVLNAINQQTCNKSFNYVDYGWSCNTPSENGLLEKIKKFEIFSSVDYICTEINGIRNGYNSLKLDKQNVCENRLFSERIVSIKINDKLNTLIVRLRNVFAHSNFWLVQENNQKYFVFEDHDKYRVTARGVLKFDTLIEIVTTIMHGG